MPEQATTPARHQAILESAAAHLKNGDAAAYWRILEQISPAYARLAGLVAGDDGPIAKGARERLQDAAEAARGSRFTDQEMKQIVVAIAERDLDIRRANLKTAGAAGVSLSDTDAYHADVFKDRGLPPETYTLHNYLRAIGPMAEAWKDTDDLRDRNVRDRLFRTALAHNPPLVDRFRNGMAVAGDLVSFLSDTLEGYAHGFEGWPGDKVRKVREMFGDDGAVPGDGSARSAPDGTGRTAIMDSLTRPDGPLHDIRLKRPQDLTDGEVRQIIGHRQTTRDDAEREALFGMERAHFDHVFGGAQVRRDATGRIVDPVAVNAVNTVPVAVRDAGGRPLDRSLGAVAGRVADLSDELGGVDAVKSLQRGLNILAEWSGRDPADHGNGETRPRREHPAPAARLFAPLKDDGVAGPKTRGALRAATAALGGPRVEEGLALGRFHGFAREAAANGGDVKQAAEAAFGPLFRRPGAGAGRARPEGFGLQMAVNDLGRDLMGGAFRPLREDGDIGPRTTDAFRAVLAAAGPDRFTRQLGRSMGFLGDGDGVIDAA